MDECSRHLSDTLIAQLPHRPPFLFLSSIIEHEPGAISRAIWSIDGSEWFFQGHFPNDPIVPGVLITEALAQLAGLVAFDRTQSDAVHDGRLAQCDIRFESAARPPIEITLQARLQRSLGVLQQCEVEASAAGSVVARGSIVLSDAGSPHASPKRGGVTRMLRSLVCAASVLLLQPEIGATSPTAPCTAQDVEPPRAELADDALTQELAELDARISAVRDVTARFSQEKHSPLLKKPLRSSGTVRAQGDRVRWDTEKPSRSTIVSTGSEFRFFDPEHKTLEIIPIDGALAKLAGSPMPRLALLAEHFSIERMNWPSKIDSDTGPTLPLRLLPRSEDLATHVREIHLLLRVRDGCVMQVEVLHQDDEWLAISFSEHKLNTGLSGAELELVVPSGTRIIKLIDESSSADER